jgi:hypothetical protein
MERRWREAGLEWLLIIVKNIFNELKNSPTLEIDETETVRH